MAAVGEIVVKLSGGYPHHQLDRLIAQLGAVAKLRKPAVITLDLGGLVFFGPTAQAVVAATFRRIVDKKLASDGSVVTMPRAKNVAQYIERMDVIRPFAEMAEETFTRREPVPEGARPRVPLCESASGIWERVRASVVLAHRRLDSGGEQLVYGEVHVRPCGAQECRERGRAGTAGAPRPLPWRWV